MTRSWMFGIALAGLACATAHAQTADEIIARHLAARGGLERIRSVQSLRMHATATRGSGESVLLSREIKRPGRIRLEFTYQGVTGVYACDGEQGWRVSPSTGSMDPQLMAPPETRAALEQADIDGPFVDSEAKGITVELLGRVPVAGRQAFKFKATSKNDAVRHFYVDADTYLLVRTDATRTMRGRTVQLETTFADYRDVNGLRFPPLIESAARGRPAPLRIVVDIVEVGPAIEDARFSLPGMAAR